MHNNKFEKKVKLRMEELRFSPADSVWQNVELQISQRKRRRRILFWWIPVGFLCLGTAGWFLYHATFPAPGKKQQVFVNNQPLNTEASSPSQTVASNKKELVTSEDKKGTNKQQPLSKVQNTQADEPKKKNEMVIPPSTKKETTVEIVKIKQPISLAFTKKNEEEKTLTQKDEEKAYKDMKENNPINTKLAENRNTDEINSSKVIAINDTVTKQSETHLAIKKQKLTTDSSEAVAKINKSEQKHSSFLNKKVEWFARFGTGISNFSQFSSGLFAAFANDYNSPGSQSPPGSGNSYKPSSIKPGIGFSAGIELRTTSKKRSAFSVGLNYNFYATSIKTGSTVYSNMIFNVSNYNSLVSNYLRMGDSITFHNHYSFFELPFLYHLRLSKQQKRPLILNTGLSYNYLLASNANYYSSLTGSYYFDKKLFSRSQFHLKLGLSSSFIKRENYPLQVGIQYQLGLSGLWKHPLNLNQHLSYTGIEILWRLHK